MEPDHSLDTIDRVGVVTATAVGLIWQEGPRGHQPARSAPHSILQSSDPSPARRASLAQLPAARYVAGGRLNSRVHHNGEVMDGIVRIASELVCDLRERAPTQRADALVLSPNRSVTRSLPLSMSCSPEPTPTPRGSRHRARVCRLGPR